MEKIILICAFLMLSGCNQPLANPETIDPIYKDISKRVSDAENAVKDQQKELETLKADMEKAGIRTGQREFTRDDYFAGKKKLQKLMEKYRYWKIEKDKRLEKVKVDYFAAYEKEEEWPHPDEYKEWKLERKLKDLPRDWSPERRIKQWKKSRGK